MSQVPSLSRPVPAQSGPRRERYDTMPPTFFTKNVDLKLIQLVKENPVLYNSRHPKYTDSDTREVTWQKIGDSLNRPARKCKSRWLNIRDMMRRTIRNRIRYPEQNQHKYRFEDEVAFAIPYFKYNNTPTEDYTDFLQENSSNMAELPAEAMIDDNLNFDNDNDMLEVKPTLTFRKRNEDASSSREFESSTFQELSTSDPMDVFLMTIGSTLRKFSPLYLNQAKSKIFQIVQDFELKQIVEKESQGTTNADSNTTNSD